MNLDLIPDHMHGAVIRYVEDGIEPGGFLEAVLCNDLKGAVMRADAINKARLFNAETNMIIGYARCSTDRQELNLQFDALKAVGCEKIYHDVMSGAKTERPELRKCLDFLQSGDVLVVYKLDRLSRSLKHLVNTVLDLNDRGVDIIITSMQIDTRTPTGKLIFGIMASIADFERELIRERVNAGIKAAKARGVKFGRDTVITQDMIEATKSSSVRSVARQYGVSKSALYDRLSIPSAL